MQIKRYILPLQIYWHIRTWKSNPLSGQIFLWKCSMMLFYIFGLFSRGHCERDILSFALPLPWCYGFRGSLCFSIKKIVNGWLKVCWWTWAPLKLESHFLLYCSEETKQTKQNKKPLWVNTMQMPQTHIFSRESEKRWTFQAPLKVRSQCNEAAYVKQC